MSSLSPHLSSERHWPDRQRSNPIGLRVRVLLSRGRLDALLLGGVDLDGSPELALRAAQLTSSRHRRALANSLGAVLGAAEGDRPRSAAVPLARGEVRAARAALGELEQALRERATVEPAGVVLTERLLTDGTGPLYIHAKTDGLWHAAKCASAALEGYRWG
jgi:hypothetical protein